MVLTYGVTDQLLRALPKEMMAKYEERLKDEALNLADIEDLVRYDDSVICT